MYDQNSVKRRSIWQAALVVFSGIAVVLSIVSIYLVSQVSLAQPIQGSGLLNFLGITIGAVALVATVGFLVLAFPIWSELGAIAEERTEIAKDRSDTLELRHRVEQMMRDLEADANAQRSRFDETIDELNAPYSRYTGIFESIQLLSTVIRYIGTPLWEEEDAGARDGAESEAERIERHVSLVQQLMAALAVEPKEKPALYLAFLRDAVGHLRASDDQIFFEFIETRLRVVHPTDPDHQTVFSQTYDKFVSVRAAAIDWRKVQNPIG